MKAKEMNKNFLAYLDMLQNGEAGEDEIDNTGTIVYVDDQFIPQHVMKMHMDEIGIADQVEIFTDGI